MLREKSLVIEMIDNPTGIHLMQRALEEFDVVKKY